MARIRSFVTQVRVNIASQRSSIISRYLDTGAQPAFHFGGNFHEISFDDVLVLIQPWYNFCANGHFITDKVLFATFPKMRNFQF